MYLQAWRKYLPVIVLLIKRSALSPQTLTMDKEDFVKSSGGKKIKLGFTSISIYKGRMYISPSSPQIARDLVLLLQESEQVKDLLPTGGLHFAMSNDCVLEINSEMQVPQ